MNEVVRGSVVDRNRAECLAKIAALIKRGSSVSDAARDLACTSYMTHDEALALAHEASARFSL